jgi:hypothetical protein
VKSTQVKGTDNTSIENETVNVDSLDELNNRFQYVIESVGYQNKNIEVEYAEAMARKLVQEQNTRNAMYQKKFMKLFGRGSEGQFKKETTKIKPRTEDAQWHISFYSDRDKKWIEIVMRELGCRNFELYSSIDDCLAPFKKKYT